MIGLKLLLAVTSCVLPLIPWLDRVIPRGASYRYWLLAGYSTLLGMVFVTVLMRLLNTIGITLSPTNIYMSLLLIFLAGFLVPPRLQLSTGLPPLQASQARNSKVFRAITLVCLGLIAFRLLVLGMEVATRPIFAWDAKQHWAKQAKVFFDHAGIPSFVSLEEWLLPHDEVVFTNMHPDYPIGVPLLQAWFSLALGQWHDVLVNIPWLMMFAALGMIFYAQLRYAGASDVVAIASTYMMLSLPYLNTHVALAGYADLLLACLFLGAAAAFGNWSIYRQRDQLMLAILCASCCLTVKNEGLYWLLSVLPGIVLVMLGIRRGLVALGLALIVLIVALWLMPGDLSISGHTIGNIDFLYRPESWQPILQSFFTHDNWHLLSYLFLGALLIQVSNQKRFKTLAPLWLVILSALSLYLVLYLTTRHAHGAVYFTSLNRVALQLIPVMAFFTGLAFVLLVQEQHQTRVHPTTAA